MISSQMGGENEHASVGVLEFTKRTAAMPQPSQCVSPVTIHMLVEHRLWVGNEGKYVGVRSVYPAGDQ